MRYNRTRPESRINTGFSLISSKQSAGKSPGGEDNFRSLGGEKLLLSKSKRKGELENAAPLSVYSIKKLFKIAFRRCL